jgi:hypothetical protein
LEILVIIYLFIYSFSVVTTATLYELESTGIESRWGRDFPHPSRPALRPTHLPKKWLPDLFLRGKVSGAWRWPSTPSGTEVEERVELYLYSASGLSWLVTGQTSPLFWHICLFIYLIMLYLTELLATVAPTEIQFWHFSVVIKKNHKNVRISRHRAGIRTKGFSTWIRQKIQCSFHFNITFICNFNTHSKYCSC